MIATRISLEQGCGMIHHDTSPTNHRRYMKDQIRWALENGATVHFTGPGLCMVKTGLKSYQSVMTSNDPEKGLQEAIGKMIEELPAGATPPPDSP